MIVSESRTSTNATARQGGQRFTIGSRESHDPIREGLVLLCRQFGRDVSATELADGLPLESGRLALMYIPKALRRASINARVASMPVGDFNDRLLPALLLMEDGSTLLLVAWQGDKAEVLVPESQGGSQLIEKEKLSAIYSGIAVVAKPRYQPDGRAGDFAADVHQHWLKGPLKSCWPVYLEVCVAALVANMLAVSTSLFAMQVYDRVVPNNALETLWVLVVGVAVALVFEFILRTVRAYLLDGTGKRLDLQLSSRLYEQVMQIRLSAKPASVGAFSSQVREFESVRDFFTSSTAVTLSDVPFVFLFLGLIAYLGGPVVYVPLVAIVLMLLPGLLLQGKMADLSRRNLREGAVKHGLLLETIENLEVVKAVGAEGRNLHLWEQLAAQLADDSVRVRRLSAMLNYGASMVQQLCYIGVIVVGVYQIHEGAMTVGALIACSILASRTVAPINQMASILARWQYVKVALEGLDSLMDAPVERPQGRQFARKGKLQGNYALENLVFRYHPEGSEVLNIKQLKINAGERVVLLGGNGVGKSTLLRLLAGFSDFESGRITLDGISLSQIDPADRRRAIGYLPQDSALFYGTLRDNLVINGESYSDEELFEAIDAVGLGRAVRGHPLGLDMQLAGNNSVSGGQRQAIALARLILQDPRIVLMDEPTAAFDQANESNVVQYLHKWLRGRTLVVATHKRTLLALGDRGIVLQDGSVTMDGPLTGLMKGNQVKGADGEDD